MPALAPRRLHEIIHAQVGGRVCLEAQPAFRRRGRLVASPLLLLYACCRSIARTRRKPHTATRFFSGRTQFGHHCRRHVDLEHRHQRVLGGVGVPHAFFRVGKHRLHRRVARSDHESAALETHHVVRARAAEAVALQDVCWLRGEFGAKRLLHVHPSGDGVHRLFARDLIRAQWKGRACHDSRRNNCSRVKETIECFFHVASLLWLGFR